MAEKTTGPAESPKARASAANGTASTPRAVDTADAAEQLPVAVELTESPAPATPAPATSAGAHGRAHSTPHSTQSHGTDAAGHKKKKKHKARIEHNIPGRIRMKIPTAKTDPGVLDAYISAFSALPGVAKVVAKPETGSITLHYDHKAEAEFADHLHNCCHHNELHVESGPPEDEVNRLASRIAQEADFLADHSPLAKGAVDFFKAFDRELKLVSNNTIDMKIFLAGGLAAFTFLEIGAAAATPMWVTLGLFGVNHFVELQATPATRPVAQPDQESATQR